MNQHSHDNTRHAEKVTAHAATAKQKASFPKDAAAARPLPVVLFRVPDAEGRTVLEVTSDGVVTVFNPETGLPAVRMGNLADPEGNGGFVSVLDAKGSTSVEIDAHDGDGGVRVYRDDDEILRLGEFDGYPAEGKGHEKRRSRGVRIIGPDRKEAASISTVLETGTEEVQGGGYLVLNTPEGEIGLVADAALNGRSTLILYGEAGYADEAGFPYVSLKADGDGGGVKVHQGPFGPGKDTVEFAVGVFDSGRR